MKDKHFLPTPETFPTKRQAALFIGLAVTLCAVLEALLAV